MTERGHDCREARALTSETSGDVVPEIVKVEVPIAQSGDQPLEGSADRGAVYVWKDPRTGVLWKCPKCSQEDLVQWNGMGVPILRCRECHRPIDKIEVFPPQVY